MEQPHDYRFYGELARWWPLVSPPEEYEEEAAFVGSILVRASIPVQTVLELGSGGGHLASHLRTSFEFTLVDLSPEMLEVSRALNPECEHLQGDMRTVRLDRLFDAVLIYDAVDYMTTASDLSQAIQTAFAHCRPGGAALFVPDHIRENFIPDADHGGTDDVEGRGVRYLEWTRDANPDDTVIETDYMFLLREADGTSRIVHETHDTGLFSRVEWLQLLSTAGFQGEVVLEETTEDRPPRELFLGHRGLPQR
jgi:SAM-dependent methyltransferase